MFAVFIITGICLISVFVSYLAFRRGFTRSADDYFVAGSSLGYFVLIFSMLASFLSARKKNRIKKILFHGSKD